MKNLFFSTLAFFLIGSVFGQVEYRNFVYEYNAPIDFDCPVSFYSYNGNNMELQQAPIISTQSLFLGVNTTLGAASFSHDCDPSPFYSETDDPSGNLCSQYWSFTYDYCCNGKVYYIVIKINVGHYSVSCDPGPDKIEINVTEKEGECSEDGCL